MRDTGGSFIITLYGLDMEKLLLDYDKRVRGREAEAGRRPLAVPAMPAADAAQLEETYLRRVMVSCNALPLAIIDPQAAERTHQRTMELLAVYVALDTQTAVAVEREEPEEGRRRRRPEEMLAIGRETRPLTAL